MNGKNMTQSCEAELPRQLFKPQKVVRALGEKVQYCQQHGEYTSVGINYLQIKDIWSKCPACAKIIEEKEAVENKKRQIDARMAEFKRRFGLLGVPARFSDCSFETYTCETNGQKKALEICRDFAENFDYYKQHGEGLALLGQMGNGKTHLAISIFKKVVLDHTAIYTSVGDLIRSVRATWNCVEQKESDVLGMYNSVDLLIIDEIGVQTRSDNEQQILFGILNHRYNEKRCTIILSNCPARTYMDGADRVIGVDEYLGARAFDRLVQVSQVVGFTWDSYRKTARRERLRDPR